MKKRAPKLIDMIELDWTNNTVSARTTTPPIDTLTEEQKIKMYEEGKKISKNIKIDSNFIDKGYKSYSDQSYKNLKASVSKIPKVTVGAFASAAGVPLFGIASGAMYQEGRPKKDILLGLPVEFGTFGVVPVTDLMQNWRIRDDLEKKGLSFKERNEAMSKYSRAKTQLAIDKDEVGLESWALKGLPKDQIEDAFSIREDEEKRLLETKIERGFDVETGTYPDRDPIAFEEAPYAEGGTVPRSGYKEGLGTIRGTKKVASNLFKKFIKQPGVKKKLGEYFHG